MSARRLAALAGVIVSSQAAMCVAVPLAAATASCFVPDPVVPRPEVVRIVDTESDKAMTVVRNGRIDDHEPGPVLKQTVASAMLASGLFQEDDARSLAGPIADEMPRMTSREQVRIVAWAEDSPRIYYAFIHGGKLRIAYYRGAEELERHEATIPAEAIPIGGDTPPPAPQPSPAPGSTLVLVTAQPSASVAAAPPARPSAEPVAFRSPPPRAAAPARPVPALPPLSEEDARKKLRALDELLGKNLITPAEYKRGKREILVRL